MTRIIFPMAKPSIITIILFNFLSFWNEYIISMTLMSSTSAPRTLPVGLLNLMQAQQSAAQYGTMYALSLIHISYPVLTLIYGLLKGFATDDLIVCVVGAAIMGGMVIWMHPVSYTHLDVYKRQVPPGLQRKAFPGLRRPSVHPQDPCGGLHSGR